ncbi:hypothetical protein AWB79_03573 [Caballeronia hypogeia]|uniref:Uncharacterized protein n=1 Tax=Caballeronia hypogeia TaxID=1777140 RepID=A0A158BFI4_9BURK|nr:hypothetical protein AWB79_03573 [Caballeronia hypogeia]
MYILFHEKLGFPNKNEGQKFMNISRVLYSSMAAIVVATGASKVWADQAMQLQCSGGNKGTCVTTIDGSLLTWQGTNIAVNQTTKTTADYSCNTYRDPSGMASAGKVTVYSNFSTSAYPNSNPSASVMIPCS